MERRTALKSLGIVGLGTLLAPRLWAQIQANQPFTFSVRRADFGPDFKWGVATAAYQIEGAWNEGGKGPSVWDTFTQKKGNIKDKTNGNVACDFYHRYAQDIEMMADMGMQVFRFSISWARIFPQGTGTPNPEGVAFYHRVIDTCIQRGLEPWITCYHWDLPQALEDRGGWPARESVQWFCDYVEFIANEYGSKVKHWMVFNEPAAFTGLGYLAGIHAPGKMSLSKFLASVHHVVLAQAEAGRVLRKAIPDGQIGTTFSVTSVEPKSIAKRHQNAAARMDALFNRLFLEPALGMGYPYDGWSYLSKIEKYILPGDLEKIKFDFDFIGLQNYFRTIAKHSIFPPIMWANQIKPKKIPGAQLTDMHWEVHPEGIYKVIMRTAAYPNVPPIVITENGAAFPDVVKDGRVHDEKRIAYFNNYLFQVLKAQREGAPVKGYFVWTFMDNFEWAEGYRPRFGLVYVDYPTQQRIIKDSGLWFTQLLKSQ